MVQSAGVSFICWGGVGRGRGYVRFRGGSRIFFRRGCTSLLLYFNTNKPHSFFLQKTSCIRKPQVISGGCAHPLHPPPRSAPVTPWLCTLFSVLQLFHYKFITAFLFSEKGPKLPIQWSGKYIWPMSPQAIPGVFFLRIHPIHYITPTFYNRNILFQI